MSATITEQIASKITEILPKAKAKAFSVQQIIEELPKDLVKGNNQAVKKRVNRALKKLRDDKKIIAINSSHKGLNYYVRNKSTTKSEESKKTEKINTSIKDQEEILDENFKQSNIVLNFLKNKTRKAVGHKKEILCDYVPNKDFLIDKQTRDRLQNLADRLDVNTQANMQADTYTKKVIERLLIDLSYNSARLEGNTLSLLDTEKLLADEDDASYGTDVERAMILNHKQAIEFIVDNIHTKELSHKTINDIHFRLMEDILPAWRCGGIRGSNPAHTNDGLIISGSSYVPIENPRAIDNYLKVIAAKGKKISNPFEQSFFLLIHIAYLQAYIDGNKRTSRIASALPLVRARLAPNSFMDIEVQDYNNALMYFYETGDHKPFLQVFEYAYQRSVDRFIVVLDAIEAPNIFRLQTRKMRKIIEGLIIKDMINNENISPYIDKWMAENDVNEKDFELFKIDVLKDISELNPAKFSSIGIDEEEYAKWSSAQKNDYELI